MEAGTPGWLRLPPGWTGLPPGWTGLPPGRFPSGWTGLPPGWPSLPSGWSFLSSSRSYGTSCAGTKGCSGQKWAASLWQLCLRLPCMGAELGGRKNTQQRKGILTRFCSLFPRVRLSAWVMLTDSRSLGLTERTRSAPRPLSQVALSSMSWLTWHGHQGPGFHHVLSWQSHRQEANYSSPVTRSSGHRQRCFSSSLAREAQAAS